MGLESLYHDTNRNISGTHAALAQLNNRVSYGGETSEQNQSLNARKIEGSINTIMRQETNIYINLHFGVRPYIIESNAIHNYF